MKWIIKHNPSGRYICSKQLTVHCCEYARKFNSTKQAKIYLNGSSFLKSQCTVEEYAGYVYDAASEDERAKEIAEALKWNLNSRINNSKE